MKLNIKSIVLVLAIVSMLAFVACSKVPSDLESASVIDKSSVVLETSEIPESIDATFMPINKESSMFEFEGFMAVKSHVGTFDIWSGELGYDAQGKLVAAKGVIDPTSVNTGIAKLDDHLKTDDFFDVGQFPEIKIESTNINYETSMMTAMLTLHGVTKLVSFPVEFIENGIKSDFLLDVTPFNFKFTKIDSDVRIAFTFMS